MRADVVSQGRKADYAYGDRRAPSCIEATPDFRLHGHFWATMGRPIDREWSAAIRMTIQRDRKIDGLGVRGVLHSSMRFLTGSKAAVNTAVVNWAMRWLSSTAVSTPSLISLCCNSMKSVRLFTAASACIAAVKFLAFFVVNSRYALVNS
jgi:hypothetical protein